MTEPGFTLFDTAIGRCGIAWTTRGVLAVNLPEADERRTRARVMRRCPRAREQAPPPEVARAIDGIVALLRGEPADLTGVALDMAAVPPFNAQVYAVARTIPPGRTITYGEIGKRLDIAGDAREIGQAMGQNPFPLIVPCHRVVAAGRKSGGFSANGGVVTKLRLLAIEGAEVDGTLPLFERAPGRPG
ncbi:MAG TPA: methylated-DNA--[protein]-cysteine S-methyltransferase [Xanthobacteraceae bacterium]|nr:methylated-DNA--[protein]-cysteine S-methyltransferase [Xanthobacteraceae bacterium]